MGKLIDDKGLTVKRHVAADLVVTVEDLLNQETSLKIQADTLKAKIKIDVSQDKWITADFLDLAKTLQILEQIPDKKASYKTELTALKTQVANVDYETEIQEEINKL